MVNYEVNHSSTKESDGINGLTVERFESENQQDINLFSQTRVLINNVDME